MTEKTLERFFVRKVRERGGKTYKFVSPGNTGVPDRIAISPMGEVWFVELKTESGRLSRAQSYQIDGLRNLGCRVRVLYGREQVERFVSDEFG